MTTKQIIQEMDKGFDEKFTLPNINEWGYTAGADYNPNEKKRESMNIFVKPDEIKDFIIKYSRTLLESFGEEVIGQDTRHITDSKGIQNIVDENEGNVSFDEIANEVQKDIDVQNELRAEQRLKVKEIISSIGK